ncbi:MAG: hypothetical protein QOH72_3812 [Solirubrobacteraceae bacterium]|nr:hypothetical protein [Solirubrobacteraceae bacterium]
MNRVLIAGVDNQPEWAITRSGIAPRAPALRALEALGLIDAVAEAGFGPGEDEPALMRALLEGFSGAAGDLRDQIVDPEPIMRRPVEAILVPAPSSSSRRSRARAGSSTRRPTSTSPRSSGASGASSPSRTEESAEAVA